LNYLDRNNIATARLSTLEKDLYLQGTQYNTIISIFFVGYFLIQIPMNLILDKMRPSLFLPAVICMWAIVSACTGTVQSYSSMVVLRFILGFVETPVFRELVCCLFVVWILTHISWCALPLPLLVHKARTCSAYIHPVCCMANGGSFRWTPGCSNLTRHGRTGNEGLSAWRWQFIIE
jgi:MFS family permease